LNDHVSARILAARIYRHDRGRRCKPALATSAIAAETALDAELIALEERIFELDELAHAHDEELHRLHDCYVSYSKQLLEDSLAGRNSLTHDERWELVGQLPEAKEEERLVKKTDLLFEQRDELIKRMWATPAHTSEGRRAKAIVLIGCIMQPGWRERDETTEWDIRKARDLLLEFVGGEPGEMLRGQFA
jgi:hypothetical protein